LSPYKFCLNSILCYVFYLLSPSPCHPSILPWYSSLFWLFKISSLPPQLESGCLPIWPLGVPSPFPFVGHVLTPSFMVLISFVLCLFTSSPTSLSVITFKTLVISMPLSSCLIWTYPLKPPLLHPGLRIMSHLLYHWLLTFLDALQVLSKYILCCVFVCYHLNPCHPSISTWMFILSLHFKASSPISVQECCLTPSCSCSFPIPLSRCKSCLNSIFWCAFIGYLLYPCHH
jgi:hypothetical protein